MDWSTRTWMARSDVIMTMMIQCHLGWWVAGDSHVWQYCNCHRSRGSTDLMGRIREIFLGSWLPKEDGTLSRHGGSDFFYINCRERSVEIRQNKRGC